MTILVSTTSSTVWQQAIRHAENACSVNLEQSVESYLVSLLMRYAHRPDIVKQVLATAYLEALELEHRQRKLSLQQVGDQCLLFAGLFPKQAGKKLVKLSYFVDIGRAAYINLSYSTNGFFGSLALQFVLLMDVLQSVRGDTDLMPLEAYEQWHALGSERALRILKTYIK